MSDEDGSDEDGNYPLPYPVRFTLVRTVSCSSCLGCVSISMGLGASTYRAYDLTVVAFAFYSILLYCKAVLGRTGTVVRLHDST